MFKQVMKQLNQFTEGAKKVEKKSTDLTNNISVSRQCRI